MDLQGDVEELLSKIAPPGPWPEGELKLRRIADVDTGLVVRIKANHAQLTPHGGPRVVERIAEAITAAGATWLKRPQHPYYPEARDEIEARVLGAISQASSPMAIPILLQQTELWRNDSSPLSQEDIARSQRLNRLLLPPMVAVIGPPNAGKSTLLNSLLGREAAIVSPHAGTTRDHIGVLLNIGGLVVQWIDTPGQRASDEPVEEEAIALANAAVEHADLRILLIAPDTPIPGDAAKQTDLLVLNKGDLQTAPRLAQELGAHLISATTGMGIESLLGRVKEALLPSEDLLNGGRWDFPGRDGTPWSELHE